MTNLKREEILGVTIEGNYIARVAGQGDIQPDELGIFGQTTSGTRTFYPWSAVDNVKLLGARSSTRSENG